MIPQELIESHDPKAILGSVLSSIHVNGPIKAEDMESLAYLKKFHPQIFHEYEPRLAYLLGLFYKTSEPSDIISYAYSIFGNAIFTDTGQRFTPVQASIRSKIIENRLFSFSAPTSAGKSFLFRELIRDHSGDIVIVVPSRALLSEYLFAIRKLTSDRKDILVLQYIDDINRAKTSRRIFIVTPERASEIFKFPNRFNITLFLYDEAQISEEILRGVVFDALVRRVQRTFPLAKNIFAHPFVENPEAQLLKHSNAEHGDSFVYRQNTVGKLFLRWDKNSNSLSYFSPFLVNGHYKQNMHLASEDVASEILQRNGSILIYVSKTSIYSKRFLEDFDQYIQMCTEIVDSSAIQLIEKIRSHIGAVDYQSDMVDLMKRGIVIHHGSLPMTVRLLIESFTNLGFAKICFATSTLLQGVNLPFDLVWIDNFRFQGSHEDKVLGLKNLIGRAGRNSSNSSDSFDYGYVIVSNAKKFSERLNSRAPLSPVSQLDRITEDTDVDVIEFIDSVKTNTIDDIYDLPMAKIERLQSESVRMYVIEILDLLFMDGTIISGSRYRSLEKTIRDRIKVLFREIYEASVRRVLKAGEVAVLNTAITILLWQVQGKSFREVIALRHGHLTRKDEQSALKAKLKSNSINEQVYSSLVSNMTIKFTPIAESLPNIKSERAIPRFPTDGSIDDINYDLLVCDTYDYIDKVISFSLSDVFAAAFGAYGEAFSDARAIAMVNYFKYGTNDEIEILLLRYGFSFEDIELIHPHLISVSENGIELAESISTINDSDLLAQIYRFI